MTQTKKWIIVSIIFMAVLVNRVLGASVMSEFPICTGNGQFCPAIHGNVVVWYDGRNGNSDLTTTGPKSCTILTASCGDTVLFGYNLDHPNLQSYIWFLPSSTEKYGGVLVGYYAEINGNPKIGYEGGVNDQGLAFDTNGLPDAVMNPHPKKPSSWATDNFWTKILRECSSVTEAINIAKNFNFGNMMDFQVHVADSTGDAVIISPGPDGELAFTRKEEGNDFLVSTNFNPANLENSWDYPCWRYDTATAMLKRIEDEGDLTVDYFKSILDAVHQEGATYNTVCSYICDLKGGAMYLYYFHQFEDVVEFNLTEELAKGERVIQISDLFSQETRDRALDELEAHTREHPIRSIIVIAAILFCVSSLVIFVYKKIRKDTAK
ncbi:MAG: hypothetical protein AYK19_15285 [Theionarchaea archaeon DG-70-1]|nr:MAG: hypothetical protein AYK19_15285 [Theionarchaea archaeon DG-70-1]